MKRALLLLLASCGLANAAVTEESIDHAGVKFRVVKLDPQQVSLVWKDKNGVPYRDFETVQTAFATQGKKVAFIMNAGIFEPGGIPSGLHREKQKNLHPLNLAEAPGNFFLKPNGVLYLFGSSSGRTPAIVNATSFPRIEQEFQIKSASWIEWAIQSGPLLLLDGQRHPAFNQGSTSKLHRNGVGVDVEKRLVFAITAKGERVNFWDFSGLFLKLGCKDALFLDGDISQMAVNPDQPVPSNQFGAMFVVSE
ncbi:MAG: phosphodiester glycosidase family protein [Verrucomicrobiota bacterium]